MATTLADITFTVAVLLIVVAQGFIFRSTLRGMRNANVTGERFREWVYAVLPAITLVILLVVTWRTMHDGIVRIDGTVPAERVSR